MATMQTKYYICITPFFPTPGSWRGAYLLDQVKAISRNSDYKVVVIKPGTRKAQPHSYIVGGIEVNVIPGLFMPSYFFNGLGCRFNRHALLKQLDALNISPTDIAICHCHTAAFAQYLSAIKRVNPNAKTIIQYHDLDPYQLRLGKLALWWPNLAFRKWNFTRHFHNIDLHLCISERVRYNLLNFPIPYPAECYEPYLKMLHKARHFKAPQNINTYVLYNGVDTNIFTPYEKKSTNSNTFIIGCIANFSQLKDHLTLIKAIEVLIAKLTNPKIKVIFIGSGETQSTCQRYITENNLEQYFEFRREVSHEHLPQFYHSLDLFVLPSYFEGFGCVYTEAAACGIPFIGCKHQGYSEYIPQNEQEDWLVEPHDYHRLAKLIHRQITSPIPQHLAHKLNIDTLIKPFIKKISAS